MLDTIDAKRLSNLKFISFKDGCFKLKMNHENKSFFSSTIVLISNYQSLISK